MRIVERIREARDLAASRLDAARSWAQELAASFAETANAGGPVLAEVSADTSHSLLYLQDLLVPQDEILNAHGNGDLRTYRPILRDDQVFSTFSQLRNTIISKSWKVDPGGPSTLDSQAADWHREQLNRIAFDRISFKMLTGVHYGRAYGECMWALDDEAKVILSDVLVRKPWRFRYDREHRLVLVDKPTDRIIMPDRKFWTFQAGGDDDDDPYGLGLGHYLYWPVWFKKNGVRFWSLWIEQFASGTAVAKGPVGMDEKQEAKLLQILRAITGRGRIVIPKNVEIEILRALRDSGESYDRFCERLDKAISKIVLTQTMTTDDGSSRSQAEVHHESLKTVVQTYADLLCESFTKGPVTWLTEWNFPGAKPPVVWRDCRSEGDVKERAERDEKLYKMGWELTEDYVLETYGEGYRKKGSQPVNDPDFDLADPSDDVVTDERVLIIGGPKTGKTTVWGAAFESAGVDVKHTDDLIDRGLSWSEQSEVVMGWFREPGPWVIEGVTLPRALRKWIASEDGAPCDRIIYLTEPLQPLTGRQRGMTGSVETVFKGVLLELIERGVAVVYR